MTAVMLALLIRTAAGQEEIRPAEAVIAAPPAPVPEVVAPPPSPPPVEIPTPPPQVQRTLPVATLVAASAPSPEDALLFDRLMGPAARAAGGAAKTDSGSLLSTLWPLGIAAAGAVGFFVSRRRGALKGLLLPTKDASLDILSKTSVGSGGTLLLVDVRMLDGARRRLLIGSSGAGPSLVADLGDDNAPIFVDEQAPLATARAEVPFVTEEEEVVVAPVRKPAPAPREKVPAVAPPPRAVAPPEMPAAPVRSPADSVDPLVDLGGRLPNPLAGVGSALQRFLATSEASAPPASRAAPKPAPTPAMPAAATKPRPEPLAHRMGERATGSPREVTQRRRAARSLLDDVLADRGEGPLTLEERA
jgi:hypothetical protein